MDLHRLLQQHTIQLYSLDEKEYNLHCMNARELLHPNRFDLFAKLFYIDNKKSNPDIAKKVYLDHIKAFNPDGKEPGREDKNNFNDFLSVFDQLISCFEKEEFDDTISIIPISEEGVILDGAHRVAALAYYNKNVTVAQFKSVHPVCSFDYQYFLNRGLSWGIADIIARELLVWRNDVYVACLWPKMGGKKEKKNAINVISEKNAICYEKAFNVKYESLVKFIYFVYQSQPWVGNESNQFEGARDKALNCYDKNKSLDIVFFIAEDLTKVIELKEKIRSLYQLDKHSIHISDNFSETKDIASYTLYENGLNHWLFSDSYHGLLSKCTKEIAEQWFIFKKVKWISFKTKIYKMIFGNQ